MNPADFLDVARQFQASAIEAERRTCIGPSYYAVYNILIGFLSSEGIFFHGDGRDHKLVVFYLLESGHPDAYLLGGLLVDLRRDRNAADYEMRVSVDLDRTQFAYRRARAEIDSFFAMAPTDRSNIIQLVRALSKKVRKSLRIRPSMVSR